MHSRIKKIEITNFKGISHMVVDFSPDGTTLISGTNGSGKSTIADAYSFLIRLAKRNSGSRGGMGMVIP